MATYTETVSITITQSRIIFLKSQVRIALRKSMMDSVAEDTLTRVIDQGLEKKYIGQIDIYGLDSNEFCRAQLKIVIDWNRHMLHLKEGRESITFPEKWVQLGAIEVEEMTKLFREFVEEIGLRTIWQFDWAPGVDVERARQELGTVRAEAPQWDGKPDGISSKVSRADEMNIGCYFSGYH